MSKVSPTGSGSEATTRTSAAMPSSREVSSSRRSSTASLRPFSLPAWMSFSLAASISPSLALRASAMLNSARSFTAVDSRASLRAAALAACPLPVSSSIAVVI